LTSNNTPRRDQPGTTGLFSSLLGTEVEGRLLSRNGCLTSLAGSRGWTAGPLDATSPDGMDYRWDPATRLAELTSPTHRAVTGAEGVVRLYVTLPWHMGSELDINDVTSFLDHPYVQYAIRDAGGPASDRQVSDIEVTAQGGRVDGIAVVPADFSRLRRLAAKVALNAGALTWGDDFVRSPSADWLRDVLDARSCWSRAAFKRRGVSPADPEPALADQISVPTDSGTMAALEARLADPGAALRFPPQVHFGRVDSERTWIGVYLLDVELPQLVAPRPFHLALDDDEVVVLTLRQRDPGTATV